MLALAGSVLLPLTQLPAAAFAVGPDLPPPGTVTMRYIRMGNTGVQGDSSEALYVGADGNPWIGGYDPTFEEGGLARYVVGQDRFVSISNVDLPILGSPNITGSARVRDITGDRTGRLWFANPAKVFSMDPATGPSSIRAVDLDGAAGSSGGATDLDASPDGRVWAADPDAGIVARIGPNAKITTWAIQATNVAVQPRPGGAYYVWVSTAAGFSSAPQTRRFDSVTRAWSTVDPDAHILWQGSDPVDASGNLFAIREVGPDSEGITTYTFGAYGPDLTWTEIPLWDGALGAQYIQRMKAYGNGKLLVAFADGEVWRWDGATWADLGVGGSSNDGLGIQGLDLDERTGTVWTSGAGGARYRDAATGLWQRLRITNSSMGDNFPLDLDVASTGDVYVTQNVSTDIGGWAVWDGVRWKNNTQLTYGLQGTADFPFNTAGTNALTWRSSNQHLAIALTGGGLVEWTGSEYVDLNLPNWEARALTEDGAGRLWAADGSMLIGVLDQGTWTNFFEDGNPVFASDPVADPDHPRRVWATGTSGTVWTDGIDHQWLPLPGRGVVPIGNKRAWVGSDDGLYRVDMATQTSRRLPPAAVRGAETGPLGISPDGLLWYTCDADLCWLDLSTQSQRTPRTGIFHVDINPQWGSLPWHVTDAEIKTVPGGYELWMTTPSRGLTVIKVRPVR